MERWRCPACFRVRRKSYHHKVEIEEGAPLHQVVEPRVFIEDADLTLYNGDCLVVLCSLPDDSIHMCATSPPFYKLRDYGVEGQIGLEETPQDWCEHLVEVFREVRRVLRPDGTFWLEVGDSYEAKELIGAPWMLAFALQGDGWKLRAEVVWDKVNAMPESVQDRPTRSHSTVFLFSRSTRYYYDIDSIREPYSYEPRFTSGRLRDPRPIQTETLDGSEGEKPRGPDGRRKTRVIAGDGGHQNYLSRDGAERWPNANGPNIRSVWSIASEPNEFAHFATWPTKLVSRMIKAGCPEGGVVLDPFAGSGTTLMVARSLGRQSIGIELNPEYCELVAERTQQLSLLA